MRAKDFITEQPGTIAVTNTPVADKNISMGDQRMQKFKQQMQKDSGYQYTSQATKDTIKQSDKRVQAAMQKQAKVDQRQGAGQSTIQRVKPVTFKTNADNVKIAMDDIKLTQSQFEDVQAAIREHVAKNVPFTECMFRPGSAAFTEFYRQVRECADKLNLDWEDQELIATDIGECIMVEGEMVALDVPMIEEEELDERKENPFQMDLTAYDFPMDKDNSKYADPDDPDREFNKKNVSIQAQLRKSVSMNGQKAVEFTNGETVKVPRNIAEIVLSKINQAGTTQNKFKIIKYISQSYENLMNFAKNDISEAEYQGRKVKLNSPKRGGSKKFYVYTKNKKGNVIKVSWGDAKTGLKVKANDRGAVKSFVARHKCKQANDKTTARYWSCRTPRYKALGVKGGQWW